MPEATNPHKFSAPTGWFERKQVSATMLSPKTCIFGAHNCLTIWEARWLIWARFWRWRVCALGEGLCEQWEKLSGGVISGLQCGGGQKLQPGGLLFFMKHMRNDIGKGQWICWPVHHLPAMNVISELSHGSVSPSSPAVGPSFHFNWF